MNDSKLHQEGLNRLGNVLVPNDSYGIIIEQKIQALLAELYKEGKRELSTSELAAKSGCAAATRARFFIGQPKTTFPVFVPGITDGVSRLPTLVLQPRPPRLQN